MSDMASILREIAELKLRSENQDIEISMLHNAIVDHALVIGEQKAEIEKLTITNDYLDDTGVVYLRRQAS